MQEPDFEGQSDSQARTQIYVDVDIPKRLKIAAAIEGETMQRLASRVLRDYLNDAERATHQQESSRQPTD